MAYKVRIKDKNDKKNKNENQNDNILAKNIVVFSYKDVEKIVLNYLTIKLFSRISRCVGFLV